MDETVQVPSFELLSKYEENLLIVGGAGYDKGKLRYDGETLANLPKDSMANVVSCTIAKGITDKSVCWDICNMVSNKLYFLYGAVGLAAC